MSNPEKLQTRLLGQRTLQRRESTIKIRRDKIRSERLMTQAEKGERAQTIIPPFLGVSTMKSRRLDYHSVERNQKSSSEASTQNPDTRSLQQNTQLNRPCKHLEHINHVQ